MATKDNPEFQSMPVATVLIPARSEESDIGRAIDGVLSQDFPHDQMEVVVVTGGCGPGTPEGWWLRTGPDR